MGGCIHKIYIVLIYISINNVFHTLTCSNLEQREWYAHHELVWNYSKICNSYQHQGHDLLENRRNQYDPEISGAVVPPSTSKKLLFSTIMGKRSTLYSEQIALLKKIKASHQPFKRFTCQNSWPTSSTLVYFWKLVSIFTTKLTNKVAS